MNSIDIENTVKEIIERNINVDYASLEYKSKVARAISFMATQLIELVQGNRKRHRNSYEWFSIFSIDYTPEVIKYGDEGPEFIMTRYENKTIGKELMEYIEKISPSTLELLKEADDFDHLESYRNPETFTPSSKLRRLVQETIDKKAGKETRIEFGNRKTRERSERDQKWYENPHGSFPPEPEEEEQFEETEISAEAEVYVTNLITDIEKQPWTFEAAQKLYDTIYTLYGDAGETEEYERRKSSEELYEEVCLEWKKPFIVLPDLFYDLLKYSFKHIMGYRLSTIYDNTFYYTERYRTPQNAWFWQSVEKACQLLDRYHGNSVGTTEFGIFSTMVISYYLFYQHLALMKFRCNQITDDNRKNQEIHEFLKYQFHGYPDETFLGYPQMYRDICEFIGIEPQNLEEMDGREKELIQIHRKEEIRREKEKKRNDVKRADTANACFTLIYSSFHEDIKGFVKACDALRPVLINAEKISLNLETERKELYEKMVNIIREIVPEADAEKAALTLMQIYVNINLVHTRKSRTDVVDTYDFYDFFELRKKFSAVPMTKEQKKIYKIMRALLPSTDTLTVKNNLQHMDGNIQKIVQYYPEWPYEAHNSLWNLIDELQHHLDTPVKGRTDGTLSYITMNCDRNQYWGYIAKTIYEYYCRKIGVLPLDFRYNVPEIISRY